MRKNSCANLMHKVYCHRWRSSESKNWSYSSLTQYKSINCISSKGETYFSGCPSLKRPWHLINLYMQNFLHSLTQIGVTRSSSYVLWRAVILRDMVLNRLAAVWGEDHIWLDTLHITDLISARSPSSYSRKIVPPLARVPIVSLDRDRRLHCHPNPIELRGFHPINSSGSTLLCHNTKFRPLSECWCGLGPAFRLIFWQKKNSSYYVIIRWSLKRYSTTCRRLQFILLKILPSVYVYKYIKIYSHHESTRNR